jgi:hypothetical protein
MGHGVIDEWKADARGRQETCRVGKKRENWRTMLERRSQAGGISEREKVAS